MECNLCRQGMTKYTPVKRDAVIAKTELTMAYGNVCGSCIRKIVAKTSIGTEVNRILYEHRANPPTLSFVYKEDGVYYSNDIDVTMKRYNELIHEEFFYDTRSKILLDFLDLEEYEQEEYAQSNKIEVIANEDFEKMCDFRNAYHSEYSDNIYTLETELAYDRYVEKLKNNIAIGFYPSWIAMRELASTMNKIKDSEIDIDSMCTEIKYRIWALRGAKKMKSKEAKLLMSIRKLIKDSGISGNI